MNTREFLELVITAHQGGWLPIASSLPDGSGWRQYWRAWPDDADSAVALIQGLADEKLNVFYSAHLFREKQTLRENVMDSRTLFADLDEAPTAPIILPPTILNRSSDARHQAYWILEDFVPIEELERISRRLTYGIDLADHSGWYAGHMMRVPNTYNYKYVPEQKVRVYQYNPKRTYYADDFGIFPTLETTEPLAVVIPDGWIENALRVPAGHNHVHTFWDKVAPLLEKGAEAHFYIEGGDRSRCLWRLMSACFRAGLSKDEVFLLAYHSANNKFQFLRYGGLEALAKDVWRAERQIMLGPTGIRARIDTFRKTGGTQTERKQRIADACLNQMQTHGRFINARGGSLWYILERDGRPVVVAARSTQLDVLLDTMFGLNSTEQEHGYVVSHLISHCAGLPQTGEVATLSHYDLNSNTVLLHTGSKDVLRITADLVDVVTNGYRDIIFLWNEQPIQTDLKPPRSTEPWHEALFGMSMANLASDGITPPQAMALLRAWFMCLLMRNALFSRPILAIFGQPGSGKSTLFKRMYALLYGAHKAVSSLSTQQNFEQAMATDAFVALDNIDTWERWLPDAIARAAGVSEITKRKLYTDSDTVVTRLQAFLGVTAHNPKFGREDVLDRFLMITFERIQDFTDETEIIQHILENRAAYWGQIAYDLQKVLAQPIPHNSTVAQFRVHDFSKVGQRIANALGFPTDFHSAITSMVDQQKGFVLEEDAVLVNIIDKYIKADSKRYPNHEYHIPAKLWGMFDILGGMGGPFSKQYGNSVKLGRKLWAMQDALKQRFIVEWQFDTIAKVKAWRFLPKGGDSDADEEG